MSRSEGAGESVLNAPDSASAPTVAARARLLGLGLVAAAGLLLIVSAFTPWVTTGSIGIERGSEVGVGTYSGVELIRDCASTSGLVLCNLAPSDVNPETAILTGSWPLVLGAGLAVAGGTLLVAAVIRRRAVSPWLERMVWVRFAVWILALASVGLAIAQLLLLDDARYNLGLCPPRGACVEARWGPTFALVASVLGLLGITVATVSERARRATLATPG